MSAERPSHGTDVPAARGVVRWVSHVLLLTAAYAVAGSLGLLLAIPPGYSAAIWPAAGIALMGLLLGGNRLWPGVLLGSILVNASTGRDWSSDAAVLRSLAVPAAIGVGAAVQALLGASLIRRFVGYPTSLTTEREIVSFMALGGPLGCVVSASIGVTALALAGRLEPGAAAFNWWTWWIGDSIGVLVVVPLGLVAMGRPRALWRRRVFSVATPLVLALLSLIALFVYASGQEQDRLQLSWSQRAARLSRSLDDNLDKYQEVLRSIGRLYSASGEVSDEAFARFVLPPLQRLRGIQALSFNRWVEEYERPDYETWMQTRELGAPRIVERGADGELVPVNARPYHVAVEHIAPLATHAGVVGFDIASEETRRAALLRARDSGLPTATAPTKLLQGTPGQLGFLILVPIYSEGTPTTVAARRASLMGFAVGVFSIGDMLSAVLRVPGAANVDAWVYDDTPGAEKRLLHVQRADLLAEPPDRSPSAGPPPSRFAWVTHQSIAGRRWVMHLQASPGFAAQQRGLGAWVILVGGLLLVSLLGAFQLVLTGRASEDEARVRALANSNVRLEREIAIRERAESALYQAKERAQVTLDAIGEAVLTTNPNGRIDYLNPVAEKLLGRKPSAVIGLPLAEACPILDEQSREPIPNPLASILGGGEGGAPDAYGVIHDSSGEEHIVRFSTAPIRDDRRQLLGAVLVFKDVTEERRTARQMAHHATHDALTGLVNRREFERRLEHAVGSARSRGAQHALCYLDLDQFKLVNDTVGHAAGDELLKQITDVLRRCVRSRDTLARLGGDEFGLLLSNCPLSKASMIAETIVSTVRGFRFASGKRSFQVGVSIGLVPIDDDAGSGASLLSRADVACYAAKDLGRNRVHLYADGAAGPVRRHAELLRAADLRGAIDAERFRLYYQPIVPLAPGPTEPLHCEVLLRLQDPGGDVVLPGAFIPPAERYGLMGAIDKWVVRATLNRYHEVFRAHPGAQVSINISGNSLTDDGFAGFVRECFEESGVDPRLVCFELTETAAVHYLGQATRFIHATRELGCRFALDDFGSGLSSFAYLKGLSVDYLKIDGSFVEGIIGDRIDRAMVSAINRVGHEMELKTVAEYAATPEIVEALRDLGVDYAQGYALGRPQPVALLSGDSPSEPLRVNERAS